MLFLPFPAPRPSRPIPNCSLKVIQARFLRGKKPTCPATVRCADACSVPDVEIQSFPTANPFVGPRAPPPWPWPIRGPFLAARGFFQARPSPPPAPPATSVKDPGPEIGFPTFFFFSLGFQIPTLPGNIRIEKVIQQPCPPRLGESKFGFLNECSSPPNPPSPRPPAPQWVEKAPSAVPPPGSQPSVHTENPLKRPSGPFQFPVLSGSAQWRGP